MVRELGEHRRGVDGLEVAVAEGRWPKPNSLGARGVPAAAAEGFRVREEIRPDEGRGAVGSKTPEMCDRETMGDMTAKPGGAAATTAAFSRL